jgi:hypothetical protein
MNNRITRNNYMIILAVVALAAACFQLGTGWLQPPKARAQLQDGSVKFVSYSASIVFGIAPGQTARFCVGTLGSRGPALDWTVRISDERGNLLLQLPEIHSPAGEWRCSDGPRSSLGVPGELGTGRVQVAARIVVKAPHGAKSSDFIGSLEIIDEATGETAYNSYFYILPFIEQSGPF